MAIKQTHRKKCPGGDCRCKYRLDVYPEGGSGPRRRLNFKTKREAQDYETAIKSSVRDGLYVDPAKVPTLGEVAEVWLKNKVGRRPGSLHGWRTHIRHLKPLHDLKVTKITPAMIEALRDDLRATLSPTSTNVVLSTASSIFQRAMRDHRFLFRNPAALAERARPEPPEVLDEGGDETREEGSRVVLPDEVLNAGEIRRLIDATPVYYQP